MSYIDCALHCLELAYNLLFKMKYLLAGVALKIEAHCDMISTLVRKDAYVSACRAVRGGVEGDTWRRGHRRLVDASPSPVAPRPPHRSLHVLLGVCAALGQGLNIRAVNKQIKNLLN